MEKRVCAGCGRAFISASLTKQFCDNHCRMTTLFPLHRYSIPELEAKARGVALSIAALEVGCSKESLQRRLEDHYREEYRWAIPEPPSPDWKAPDAEWEPIRKWHRNWDAYVAEKMRALREGRDSTMVLPAPPDREPNPFALFSSRTYNCLKRSGIQTVEELAEMTDQELLALRNFGKESLREVREHVPYRVRP